VEALKPTLLQIAQRDLFGSDEPESDLPA